MAYLLFNARIKACTGKRMIVPTIKGHASQACAVSEMRREICVRNAGDGALHWHQSAG